MKREGRQHGMVRSYSILSSASNPRPESRIVNELDSPPTSGLFTKVSSKPTNHSKFTGKCGRPKCAWCHLHPACKSKPKAKGTQKERSRNVSGLVTSRVVDGRPGLNYSGFSATWILDHLDNDYMDDEDDDGDVSEISDVDDVYDHEGPLYDSTGIGSVAVQITIDDDDYSQSDDDYDVMSFCDVGCVWEEVDGDEGWCLVGVM